MLLRWIPSRRHCSRTLSLVFSKSIQDLASVTVLGHFFFEPFELNVESADLLVEFCRLRLVGVLLRSFGFAIEEDILSSCEKLFFPKIDLSRMQLMLLGDLGDCLDSLDGL